MNGSLSQREEEILSEVVHLYLGCGEPVASGNVARSSRTGLSPASIRNVMAALEEHGLLEQPHTSAGRVPSDAGLRYFLERLLPATTLLAAERDRLRRLISGETTVDERLDRVTRALAEMTHQVGLAATQASSLAAMRSIHFVKVSATQVLAVLVTMGGLIDSRVLLVGKDFSAGELERISNYCTESFAGWSLADIRTALERLMSEDRARYDELLSGVLALRDWASWAAPGVAGDVWVKGVEALLDSVDRRLDSMRRLVAAFSDRSTLVRLLDDFMAGSGARVLFGSQLALGTSEDLGMIVRSFELAGGESGMVGIIGRRSMDYPHLIPVVEYIGGLLGGVERSKGGIV